jgi:2-phospho-L-lactate guanylyltransferase
MISALVPVKNLSAGKSRLSRVLSPADRERLSAFMLRRVLQVLHGSGRFDLVCLVTHDERVAKIGQPCEVRVIWEPEPTNENRAIEYATEICHSLGAESLLVLPADIPFLTVQDVEAILTGTTREPNVTLCPSKEGTGTNALLRTPPDVIPARFGPNSFFLHRLEAQAKKIPCGVYPLPRVALDIDTPEDLLALKRTEEYSRTFAESPQSLLI